MTMLAQQGNPSKITLLKRYFKKADVLFVCCTYADFNIDATTAAMQLFAGGKHNYVWCPLKGDALIERARSRCASFFLDRPEKEDVLFFVDHDVAFEPEDVNKIVDHIMDGKDIVGGMYVKKTAEAENNVVLFEGQEVTFEPQAQPVEVVSLNTGFLAIHRRVFDGIIERTKDYPFGHPFHVPLCHPSSLRYRPFFQPFNWMIGDEPRELSEDWAFCMRARAAGFKIWLDPSIILEHEGKYRYNLFDRFRSKKLTMAQVGKVTIK